jgi:hypothetical protein
VILGRNDQGSVLPGDRRYVAWDQRARQLRFPLYFTSWFLDFATTVSQGTPVHQYLVQGTDRNMAMLPLAAKETAELGLVANGMPWFGSLGGVLLADQAPQDCRGRLLQGVASWLDSASVGFASINVTPDEMPYLAEYEEILRPNVVYSRRTQVTSLPPRGPRAAERLMAIFHPKARNAVRKGLAVGLTIERSDDDEAWQALVHLHEKGMLILGGRAKTTKTFDLLRSFAPSESIILTRAVLDGQTIAALLLCKVGGSLEYITPAVDANYRHTQALSALIWSEMLRGIDDGMQTWNWGGTGWEQDSLFRFKSRLGGHTVPYATLSRYSDNALNKLRAIGPVLPATLLDYYLYPFSKLSATNARNGHE